MDFTVKDFPSFLFEEPLITIKGWVLSYLKDSTVSCCGDMWQLSRLQSGTQMCRHVVMHVKFHIRTWQFCTKPDRRHASRITNFYLWWLRIWLPTSVLLKAQVTLLRACFPGQIITVKSYQPAKSSCVCANTEETQTTGQFHRNICWRSTERVRCSQWFQQNAVWGFR